ncbi:hypothetical protein PMAC_000029 [Pneumocystis sp. 'macacae']|nr:hypothetical protein PMAC_000029 [Pneumocystis sp. 'macacae']
MNTNFESFRHQMQTIGDTKYGRVVGVDSYGNTYYENIEEAPNRTRWVDYKSAEYDASQVEPEWHAWMKHMVDDAPSKKIDLDSSTENIDTPSWKKPFQPNLTFSRGAYKPYNTVFPPYSSWLPNTKRKPS